MTKKTALASPPHKLRPIPTSLDGFRLFCLGAIIAVFFGVITLSSFPEVMKTVPEGHAELTLFVARWVLFIELLVLAIRWILATDWELKLWMRYLEHPEHTAGRRNSIVAMLALSLNLGLMLALPHNVLLISGYLSVSLLLNYWTQWLSNDHFERSLKHTRESHAKELAVDSTWREALPILEYYWTKRPQLGRLTIMMFFVCLAFSLALASEVGPNTSRLKLQLGAYAVLIIDVFAGELFVSRWRYQRDQSLDDLVAKAPLISRAHAQEA